MSLCEIFNWRVSLDSFPEKKMVEIVFTMNFLFAFQFVLQKLQLSIETKQHELCHVY